MARRRVNRVMGQDAGFFGFSYLTSIMIAAVIGCTAIIFWLTGNFMAGMITGLIMGALIQLVTNGKPGRFYNSFYKRPNWVRQECQYINEWSPCHQPRTDHLIPDIGAGIWLICIGAYLTLMLFFSHLAVPGIAIFLMPYGKFFWRKLKTMLS